MVPFTVVIIIPTIITLWSHNADLVPAFGKVQGVFHIIGLNLWVGGLVLLTASNVSFHIKGKGTLVPWAAPKHLVVSGLYR